MFQKTRLELTAWYLLIIMAISIAFSGVIYVSASREFGRVLRLQKSRLENPEMHIQVFGPDQAQIMTVPELPVPDPEVIHAAELRVLEELVIVNICVLVLSAISGYFLAGRTLKPISEMIDEQNRFITDASHELNTPVTSIRTTIEVNLRDKALSLAKAKNVLQSNLEEVETLQALSNELIGLTRYQESVGNTQFATIMLKDIVQSAREKVKTAAKEKQTQVTVEISDLALKGDRKSLTELFVILLDNAIKYSGKKKQVTVTGNMKDGKLTVEVKDEGIGIAPSDLPYIFDRFYRADKSRTKQQTSGYGLGLSIAKRIVLLHNGSIRAASTLGTGTTFTLTFPAA